MNIITTEKSALYPNAHWYFALAVVVTWAGFSRSYCARLDDERNHGRIWKPYPLALMLFGLLPVGMNLAGEWAWWHASMDGFAKL